VQYDARRIFRVFFFWFLFQIGFCGMTFCIITANSNRSRTNQFDTELISSEFDDFDLETHTKNAKTNSPNTNPKYPITNNHIQSLIWWCMVRQKARKRDLQGVQAAFSHHD
jgi:hypothetical protein